MNLDDVMIEGVPTFDTRVRKKILPFVYYSMTLFIPGIIHMLK